MPEFVVTNSLGGVQQALSASYKTIIAITAQTASLNRFRIWEMTFGTNGAPADNSIEWDVSLQTAAGAATAVTPRALDPYDQGNNDSLCVVNATVEGTITPSSTVYYKGLNQRASFRWVETNPAKMLIAPAVNLAGLAIRARSSTYTGTVTLTVKFTE